MDQQELLDDNLYKIITRCYINNRSNNRSEIFVIYEDDRRENIWTFDPNRYDFDRHDFIGMTKLEAVFHCDRTLPMNRRRY